jgi:FKBP-type peptidyl-prolyl cis-trans isomerase
MARALLFGFLAVAGVACIEPLRGGGAQCSPLALNVASQEADTITIDTGLRFVPGDSGFGNTAPWCKTLAVQYTAYLTNGTKFDSSIDVGRALVFVPGIGALIDGFEQGVIGMRSCGSRRLIIPPGLAYGPNEVRNNQGQVIVPANSTVIYDVKVLLIEGEQQIDCDNPPTA